MSRDMRLVDVNEAIEKINGLCVDRNENWIGTDNQSFVGHADVIDILSDMSTVDAVEVVHGRWESVDHDGSWRVDRCSVCHKRMHYVDYDQPYPFCPNCGAKMDLE